MPVVGSRPQAPVVLPFDSESSESGKPNFKFKFKLNNFNNIGHRTACQWLVLASGTG